MWKPKPMQMKLLPEFFAQRSNGVALSEENRIMHPLAAQQLIAVQNELYNGTNGEWPQDKPVIVINSMTRDNAFQYRLVKQNRQHRSAAYPNGIPTATVGKSLHSFGLAIDIDTRATMRNINESGLDLSFQEFRQYLAGYGIMGISSEAWHFNFMLREEYFEKQPWEIRDHVYSENWTDLTNEQKETLLRLAGAKGDTLTDLAIAFQSRYSESLAVDGIPGTNTCRAAYVEWAIANKQMV